MQVYIAVHMCRCPSAKADLQCEEYALCRMHSLFCSVLKPLCRYNILVAAAAMSPAQLDTPPFAQNLCQNSGTAQLACSTYLKLAWTTHHIHKSSDTEAHSEGKLEQNKHVELLVRIGAYITTFGSVQA